jgi:hypothetical protein
VVAVLPRGASGALLQVLLKVGADVCSVWNCSYADIEAGSQKMGTPVAASPGAQMTMNCKSHMSAMPKFD